MVTPPIAIVAMSIIPHSRRVWLEIPTGVPRDAPSSTRPSAHSSTEMRASRQVVPTQRPSTFE